MNFDDSRWDIPIIDDRTKGSFDPLKKDKSIIDKEKSETQRQEQEIVRDADFIKNFLSLGLDENMANSIHDKYMRELSRLSELELSKAREFTPEKIYEWYFNPEPISLYGFLLMDYLRIDKFSQEEREKDDGSPSEIFDEEKDISLSDDTELEKETFIETPGRILESDLGVRLPSQAEPILDLSDIPQLDTQQVGIFTEQREMESSKLKPPTGAYSIDHILKQKLEFLERLEMGQAPLKRKVFERRWSILESTKYRYGIDIKNAQKKLGDSPTVYDVLKHLLESARNESEGPYFQNVVGIREGYPELYKKIEQALPTKSERENMKHHAKLSGYDIEVSRPMVKARLEELDDMVMKQIIDGLSLQWHKDAVRLIQITGVRRSEIQSMTMKLGSKRDTIELEWTVSKQRNGKENKNKIKILKSHFPEDFKDLGQILTRANGSKSIRQSSFERVQVFKGRQTPRALGEVFKNTRDRIKADKELYKPHGIRHQHATDLRKNGIDEEGIARELGHKEVKNSLLYGIV